jgi:hypothetical protein
MSNLEIIKQESKSDLLMPGPMPHEEMKVGKCPYPLSRGEREGQPCNEKTFDGEELCCAHQALVARKRPKEINVQVKASNPDLPIISVVQPPPLPLPLPPLPLPLAPVMPAQNASIDEILVIMRNFSISMVNLTELLKRH